jgi:hypothetical protein
MVIEQDENSFVSHSSLNFDKKNAQQISLDNKIF